MLRSFKPNAWLLAILLVGFILRSVNLATNPPALNWDYVSFGYNAYSILKTGADEYGVRFPLVFRGYDVYSLPLGIYMMIPSIALYGLTEIGVRAPAVLFGVLFIFVTYLLVSTLTKQKSIALIASFFVAISPWHIQYSREASLNILYILLATIGVLLFPRSLQKPYLLPLSVLSFTLSFYTYHSALVTGTLLMASCVLIYWQIIPRTKWIAAALFTLVIMLLPLAFAIQQGSASNRYHSVSIFQPEVILKDSIARLHYDRTHGDLLGSLLHNRRLIYAQTFIKNYLEHWRFDYLFFDGMKSRMFRIPDLGLLYLWDAPFLLVGLFALIRRRHTPYARLLLAWFLIAPVPSALALGAPSALRTVLFMPVLQIIIAEGFLRFAQTVKKLPYRRGVMLATIALLAGNVGYFLHALFVHTPIETAESWNYSVKRAVVALKQYEGRFDHVIFTNHYKQPYMYYLFYNQVDPAWFQANWYPGEVLRSTRTVGNITYRDIDWNTDKLLPNTLLVGTPDEIPEAAPIIETISSLNGEPTLLFARSLVEIPATVQKE